MLKTAIYGLLRVTFDLLHGQLWWWGVVALAVGLVTALFGVVFAAVQTDMKRLLAYSSIENIGIIVAGIGLTILFRAYDKSLLAAITLTAVLYHALNHAFFKSLLFLATGSVLHATHERSLGKLGGLIHRMPWVAWLALVGTLAIAGLPPLNGFVSEWLLLQAFLFTPTLPQSFVNMLVPLATAALVLAVALAAYVMVKFYGDHLPGPDARAAPRVREGCRPAGARGAGLPRRRVRAARHLPGQRDRDARPGQRAAGRLERDPGGPAQLAAARADQRRPLELQPAHRAGRDRRASCCSPSRSSTGYYHGRVRRAPPWDCGFPGQTPRMQDTAEGFGQPIRNVFEPFFRMERHLPSPFDAKPVYFVKADDHFWHWLYVPIVRGAEVLARLVGRIQQGRISVYLTYSFFTLLALLFFVR